MKIFLGSSEPAVALVVLRQIDFPEKVIGRLMTAYVLAAQFLNQPVLMRAVIALYSAFGLRRTGRDDADTEFGAHASKLRQWRLPRGFLGFAGGANRHSSSPYTDSGEHRIAQSSAAVGWPLPRWFLAPPIGTRWFRWHRPPDSSDNLRDHVLPTRHENFRPTAPAHQNVPCARAACDRACACALGSTALRPASSDVRSRHLSESCLRWLGVRPPGWDRSAPRSLRCTCPAPVARPGSATSPPWRDCCSGPQLGALNQPPLRCDSAAKSASLADS